MSNANVEATTILGYSQLTCPKIEHMISIMSDLKGAVVSEIVLRTPAAVSFPALAVSDCLQAELTKIVREDATLTGRVLPAEASALSHTSVELDSLRVVSILCHLDDLLGFKVKDAVVRDGGYSSIAVALGHLMPRIESEWSRHVSKAAKR